MHNLRVEALALLYNALMSADKFRFPTLTAVVIANMVGTGVFTSRLSVAGHTLRLCLVGALGAWRNRRSVRRHDLWRIGCGIATLWW